ncbi:MAG: hypothetical protein L3K02_01340 [Thermoplasmata archaeon]|nr:hypothetical protein [Thermoplasmata archaeon]
MESPGVLVVGETPSLGRSITDLLESGDVPVQYVIELAHEMPFSDLASRFPVVVAACNGLYCTTARRWTRGELPNVELVVVGSRDPVVLSDGAVHRVPLPLLPAQFLRLIRELLDPPNGSRVLRRVERGTTERAPKRGGANRAPGSERGVRVNPAPLTLQIGHHP